MASSFRVIYPRGDRTKLSIAFVYDYEEDDWSLASTQHFEVEANAEIYAEELASKFSLEFISNKKHNYLD